jgi:hypothetical protein
MLNNLKELLKSNQIQEKIKAATNQSTAVELLLTAGIEKGYDFTIENITNLLNEINTISYELSEDELLSVSGALPDTRNLSRNAPKGWCSIRC